MQIHVISLFPEMFAALNHSMTKRAQEAGLLKLQFWNPRDYSILLHRQVDDRPFGGGPGMVLQVAPLQAAVRAAKAVCQAASVPVIYLSPQGVPLRQSTFKQLTRHPELILVAGRYEGVDERFLELEVDLIYSVGDYVVSGGELPSMLLIDGLTRLIPGVLGHQDSAAQDSFSDGLLDCPHYTRPAVYQELAVPEVLLSGNHQAISRWRRKQSLGKTWQMRPDLLKRKVLTVIEQELLEEFIVEHNEE